MNCRSARQHVLRCSKCRAARRSIRVTQIPFEKLQPFPQLQQVERLLVRAALRLAGYNRTVAAEALGISREGLRKKLQRLGMRLRG